MQHNKIYRAGVIPYIINEEKIEMMFMMPNDPKGRYGTECFQLAKGKIEEGESDKQAAFREATEELGLFKGNIINEYDLGTFLGRTHVYLAEVRTKDMFGDPHFETKEVKWLTLEQFNDVGRDLHKPVIKAAVRLIESKDTLMEMTNLYSKHTGLPFMVYASVRESGHRLRVKACKTNKWDPNKCSTIPIPNTEKTINGAGLTNNELNLLFKWIKLNRPTLELYWNEKLTLQQFFDRLEKI
jgi:8-oxo-dGTP pyrophosphatase MutT (NUDIX family)